MSVTSNQNDILNDLNNMHYKIKFTHENEINNTVNYLDLTITKPIKESNLSRNLSQTNQQHNSNPQQIKTSIPTNIKHIQ